MMDEGKRLVHQSFMTTKAEDEFIRQKMRIFGIRKKATLFRALVFKGYLLKLDLEPIHEVIRLMKNLTNNINQIARRENERGSIYETEIDEILKRVDDLWKVVNQILTKLE